MDHSAPQIPLSAYLDGLPFKIGTKFIPPNRVEIVQSDQQYEFDFPVDLLDEDYDCSAEKQALNEFSVYENYLEELEKIRQRQVDLAAELLRKAAEERNKAEATASTSDAYTLSSQTEPVQQMETSTFLEASDKDSGMEVALTASRVTFKVPQIPVNNPQSMATLQPLPPISQPNAAAEMKISSTGLTPILPSRKRSDDILMPVPVSSGWTQNANKPAAIVTSNSKRNVVSFDEFDVAEASPFDIVALKSLNDLEELKSVLYPPSMNGVNSPFNPVSQISAANQKFAVGSFQTPTVAYSSSNQAPYSVNSFPAPAWNCDAVNQQRIEHYSYNLQNHALNSANSVGQINSVDSNSTGQFNLQQRPPSTMANNYPSTPVEQLAASAALRTFRSVPDLKAASNSSQNSNNARQSSTFYGNPARS